MRANKHIRNKASGTANELMNERTQQDISIENDNYQRLECEKVGEDQGVCMERTNKRKTNSTSTGKIQSTRRMFNVGRVEEK